MAPHPSFKRLITFTHGMAHLFICPNCGQRTSATDRTAGFRNQPKGCSKCGFGFLFELLDDYYRRRTRPSSCATSRVA